MPYVIITNPQVMMLIPEHSAVIIKKAIFWSVTGRFAGFTAALARVLCTDISFY